MVILQHEHPLHTAHTEPIFNVTRQPERYALGRLEQPPLVKGDAQIDVHQLGRSRVDEDV